MVFKADSVKEYLYQIPEERKEVFTRLLTVLKDNLPIGYKMTILYNFPSFVVPHSLYPKGYHCNPNDPLPFISLTSQKNFISLYHSGIYADPKLQKWFEEEYTKLNIGKLDMGKSCIRFKNIRKIPFELIGKLCNKMSVEEWIILYELNIQSQK